MWLQIEFFCNWFPFALHIRSIFQAIALTFPHTQRPNGSTVLQQLSTLLYIVGVRHHGECPWNVILPQFFICTASHSIKRQPLTPTAYTHTQHIKTKCLDDCRVPSADPTRCWMNVPFGLRPARTLCIIIIINCSAFYSYRRCVSFQYFISHFQHFIQSDAHH